jgi:activator of 2-hydroxyglutaryl-CoA dehydratase
VVNIYFAGIDLGSTMTKVVIINTDEEILARVVNHTGSSPIK